MIHAHFMQSIIQTPTPFIIVPHTALLQAEQHTDGRIIIVIDYPQYGLFDYNSNSEDFMKHLQLF